MDDENKTDRETLINVFVKSNGQSEICFNSAMARKHRMKSNNKVRDYESDNTSRRHEAQRAMRWYDWIL
jgi:hypothetical protein